MPEGTDSDHAPAAAAAGSYRFFDHTGDFGVDVEGPSASAAVAAFSRALLDLLTGAPHTVVAREARPIAVKGVDRAAALVSLGNELLFRFEVDRFLVARVEARVRAGAIEGVAHGEPFEPARHPIARPIKAVTHHGATFEVARGGAARARIVFDL